MDDATFQQSFKAGFGPDFDLAGHPPGESLRPAQSQHPVELAGGFERGALIGRGSSADVFRAVQSSLRREVALKVARNAGPLEASNFMAEALIHARLEHPNILPVYCLDSEGAVPSLALRLVGGRTWKDLLDGAPVGLHTEWSRHVHILIQVCNAVAFAHSLGIAHNDLKPSNVMLGSFGEVVLLDWGLAVAFGEQAVGLRPATSVQGPCGTPCYMAPEQARGDGASLGAATDVFLLGAILYQILVGTPPNPAESLFAALHEAEAGYTLCFSADVPEELSRLCRQAMSVEPGQRPSTVELKAGLERVLHHGQSLRLTRAAETTLLHCESQQELDGSNALYEELASALAGFRQAVQLWDENVWARRGEFRARMVSARLALRRGDLALAEAQANRLQADDDESSARACALQADVRAARDAQQAQQRRRRLVRRGLAFSLLTAAVGLVLGVSILAWRWRRLADDRALLLVRSSANQRRGEELVAAQKAAEAAHGYAEQRGNLAEEALDGLLFEVQAQLQRIDDATSRELAQHLIEQASQGWQALRDAGIEESKVSRGGALACVRLAELRLRHFGDLEGALLELGKAERIARGQLQRTPGQPEAWEVLQVSLLRQGDVLQRLGQVDRAEQRLIEALGVARSLAAAWPDDVACQADVSATLRELADVQLSRGRYGEARSAAVEALQLQREVVAEHHEELTYLTQLGYCLRLMARCDEQFDPQASYLARVENLELSRGLLFHADAGPAEQRSLAAALSSLASWHEDRTQLVEADQLFRESLALERELLELDQTSNQNRRRVAFALSKLGMLCYKLDPQAGRPVLLEAVSRWSSLASESPENVEIVSLYAEALGALAATHWKLGEQAEGEEVQLESLRFHRQLTAQDSGNVELLQGLATALANLSSAREEQGLLAEAVGLTEEAIATLRSTVQRAPDDAGLIHQLGAQQANLGQLFSRLGDHDRARAELEASRELLLGLLEDNPAQSPLLFDVAITHGKLGELCSELGQRSEAAGFYRSALMFLEQAGEAGNDPSLRHQLVYGLVQFADFLKEDGALLEALEVLDHACRVAAELLEVLPLETGIDVVLAELSWQQGGLAWELERPEQALEQFERAVRLFGAACERDPREDQLRWQLCVTLLEGGLAALEFGALDKAAAWLERARALFVTLLERYPSLEAEAAMFEEAWQQLQEAQRD